jgi:hypothetical protein
MATIPTLPRPAATQLLVIRTALLGGLLLFGAITWYMAGRGSTPMATPEQTRLYGFIFVALAASAVVGMIVMRTRLEKAADAKQLMSLYIIGYALAEGAALFGGVVWFIGGPREWYIAGLIVVVAGYQILPVRRESAAQSTSARGR